MQKQLNLPYPDPLPVWASQMDPLPYDRVVHEESVSPHHRVLIFDDGSRIVQIYDISGSSGLLGSDCKPQVEPEQLALPFPS